METTIIEEKDKQAIITLKGRLDTSVATEVQEAVAPLYEKDLERVVIDCKELEYIASSGLRIFFLLLRTMKPKGVDVVVKDASEMLKNVFHSTGFDALLKFE